MHGTTLNNIEELKNRFDTLKSGKESLLTLLEEAELPELVFNSNAIENSTLTLDETEQILEHQILPPNSSQREVFEAINLGKVNEYLTAKLEKKEALSKEMILLVHGTLLSHINDEFAGCFRKTKEYVRVGKHIAPAPEKLPSLIDNLMADFADESEHILDRIILFHLAFEHIHPFLDGNGRVGRALLNFQLKSVGYPPVIIRNKEKKDYYKALQAYDAKGDTKPFELIFALHLKESFHKRIAYLEGDDILFLSDVGSDHPKHTAQVISNAAKKQSLEAFRERGRWKVGKKGFSRWEKSHEHCA
ncbi:MAG: Fic family protein [Candidatus Peribacter sp.]|mgnify:CR=1 FL=1|jgi:Fic family protein|nr:Fic family protein [Candidatus Peribacter sp.]MBT4600530.1 Fic family protein [Candidatus Peribacter sp.]MBT5149425.1 Fic family protein [Candidatus Peribacter sp.]MBT5638555.1 Fic family protein [Candidatus Peribacter sp.]MBT5938257.1 Fic family protein [Candidatus Peribacter sp.]